MDSCRLRSHRGKVEEMGRAGRIIGKDEVGVDMSIYESTRQNDA
jgi:hypothetical protein